MHKFSDCHKITLTEKKKASAKIGIWQDNIFLFMPLTYMNNCGSAVAAFSSKKGLIASQLLVIHDELDFPCGTARFKYGGGEGGHNGLRSISRSLHSRDYWRLRIGIGKPPHKQDGKNYVLQSPPPAEREKIHALVPPVLVALEQFTSGDSDKAMQQLHQCSL